MDNTGNCNTMVEHLSKLVPGFHGAGSQTWCFPHMVNLIAKVCTILFFSVNSGSHDHGTQAFISFFYRQRSRPKASEPEKPAKPGGQNKQPLPGEPLAHSSNDPDIVAVPEPTPEEIKMCAALEGADLDDTETVDADKAIHDKQAVATVRTEAVAIAKAK